MGFHLRRNFLIFATLFLVIVIAQAQDEPPPAESEEDDDSSSEETVEDSNESARRRRRRKRFAEVNLSATDNGGKSLENSNGHGLIPSLPDPETITKIAEILSAIGQQVLPALVSGNTATEFVTKRLSRDMQFLKNIKNEIDFLTESLTTKK